MKLEVQGAEIEVDDNLTPDQIEEVVDDYARVNSSLNNVAAPSSDAPMQTEFKTILDAATADNKSETGETKPFGFTDAIKAGWQNSSAGLLARGKMPDTVLPEDASRMERIAAGVASLAGDTPAGVAGFLIGAPEGGPFAPVTGTAAAFALPTALRAVMIDAYEKGEMHTAREFVERASGVFLETAKSYVTGAVVAATGGAVGAVAKGAGSVVAGTAVTGAEIGAMVGVSSALEGELPDARDFEDAALLVFGLKAAGYGAGKLKDIYVKTGKSPVQVMADMQKDPTIKQDLMSVDTEVPKAYGFEKPEPTPKAPTPKDLTDPAVAAEANVLKKIQVGGENTKEPLTFQKAYTNMMDDLYPIKAVVDDITAGKKLPSDADPYVLARLTKGSFGRGDGFIYQTPRTFADYKPVGKPLQKVLEPIKDDLDGFRAYAVSKRAQELDARGIKSGFDAADTAAVVSAGASKYDKVMKETVEYQNHLTAYLRDSGVIDAKTHDAMLKANKDFVPFYRVMEDVGGGGTLPKGQQSRDPIKKIKGSERDVIDPIESVIKNTYAYIALAERNSANKALIDLVNKHGRTDIAEKVKAPMRPIEVSEKEMLRAGVDLPDEALTIFRAVREPLKENEIAVFTNGKREVYALDSDVAAAIKATDKEMTNFLFRMIAAPNKLFRAGVTLSPDFIPRNMIRDQIDATINSKNGYLPFVSALSGVGSLIKKDAAYQDWMASGGANATFVSLDRRYIQETIGKVTESKSWSQFMADAKKNPASLARLPYNTIKSGVDMLRVSSELVENATRVAEFKRAMNGKQGKAAILDAGFQSREVTLDFARAGVKIRSANQIIAFLNAQLQGVDRIGRAFKDNPAGTSAKVAAMVTLPSAMLWWANHDDPRYKELPDWQRDSFWIIMTDDWRGPKDGEATPDNEGMMRIVDGETQYNFGNIYRLPKPHETGVLFGSGTERFLDYLADKDPEAIKAFGKNVLATFTPSAIPTVAVPVVEQFANRSLFTGAPLIPPSAEKLLPEYQYSQYTTETTKALGQIVGQVPYLGDTSFASPAIVENYVRQWSGGLGMYAIQLADKALREAGVVNDPSKPSMALADMPIVKAFTVRNPAGGSKSIQDFYDRYDKSKRVMNTISAMAKDGDFEAVEKLTNANPNAMATLDDIQASISNMQAFIKLIYKNPDMEPDEKRQLIDATYYQMTSTAKLGNDTMDELNAALSGEEAD